MLQLIKTLMHRRGLRRAAALAAAGFMALQGSAIAADKWPAGPVQIIVSYGAGGGTDRQARLLAPELEKILGVPVVIQNLPGAGGQVAATALLREKPDGRTILATNQPDQDMGAILNKAPYKTTDFQVILADLYDPRILLVNKDSDIKTFDDLVKRAKAKPGSISISTSQGGAQELLAKWLVKKLGVDIRLVGYKSGGSAAAAMVGGQVTATLGDDFARFNIRDKSHALFIGADEKSKRWPEAPTLADALKPYGVTLPTPDFLARYGVYVVPSAFKKEHPKQYAMLQAAMIKATQSKPFREKIATLGVEDLYKGVPGEKYDATFEKASAVIAEMK
jgi:putative tricarboxylic transport membrane protein